MREMTGSWLSGPASAGGGEGQTHRGERLGLPETGAGSLPGLGVRAAALLIDWLSAYGIVALLAAVAGASLFDVASWAVPLVWGFVGAFCVWLFAQTPGQAVLGLGVARVDLAAGRVGLWRSVVRVLFVFLILPPLIQDEDGRGMHDRATGTAVIRTR